MFSKKEKYLIRDNLQRSIQLKYIYTHTLKSSLLKNTTLSNSKKKLIKLSLQKNKILTKKKNLCLFTGENKSVRKYFLTSRFKLNYLSIENKLQNFKLNSW
jgi:ribosomal protein S14